MISEMVVEKDGVETTLTVKSPTPEQLVDAQIHVNKMFRKAIDTDAVPRSKLRDYAYTSGLWTEENQKQLEEVDTKMSKIVKELQKGNKGKYKTSDKAKKACIEIRKYRTIKLILLTQQNQLDEFTLESQLENAKHDYLTSVCVYDEEGNSVFDGIDDYYDNSSETWAIQASNKLATMITPGYRENWRESLPENKLLKKLGCLNDKLQLINKDGHLVDEFNNLVDEYGRVVNKDGELIDGDGNVLDENGEISFDEVEFD